MDVSFAVVAVDKVLARLLVKLKVHSPISECLDGSSEGHDDEAEFLVVSNDLTTRLGELVSRGAVISGPRPATESVRGIRNWSVNLRREEGGDGLFVANVSSTSLDCLLVGDDLWRLGRHRGV